MAIDAAGYARPLGHGGVVPAETEARIAAACPGAVIAPWPAAADAMTVDPYWGPIRASATGHASDDAVRFAGSSGGALSALAIHALEAGLVDAVLHIRASGAVAIENEVAVSRTRAEVIAAAGSRYGPSPALETIGAVLDGEARYLFIGKPCDVSALRALGRVDARVRARIPYLLSFFCGGMPSLGGTRAIVHAMGMEAEALSGFRYRGNGWPGTARAEGADGRTATMSYAQSWGDFLSGRVQYRCKICPDAVGGSADIACADAWYGGESGYPAFDERDGRSLILTRSATGAALVAAASGSGAIVTEPLPVEEIALMQPAQARRKRLVAARSLAARLLGQRQPVMAGLMVARARADAGLGEQLRNLAGSMRRIVQGRR